jgi:hypothetical protein
MRAATDWSGRKGWRSLERQRSYCPGAARRGRERIVAIISVSSMPARILSLPPQCAQLSISMPNSATLKKRLAYSRPKGR